MTIATENAEAHDELRELVAEQAVLGRIADVILHSDEPRAGLRELCAGLGPVVGALSVCLVRFTSHGTQAVRAGWSNDAVHLPEDAQTQLVPGMVCLAVKETRAASRVDVNSLPPPEHVCLQPGTRYGGAIAVPVILRTGVWGALVVTVAAATELSRETVDRIMRFTELAGAAVSNYGARNSVGRAQSRLLAAEQQARRRVRKKLEDSAERRLLWMRAEVERLRASASGEHAELFDAVAAGIASTLDDVRELANGLHPGELARGGLEPALAALADRSPLPVALTVEGHAEVPEYVRVAAYYVVSEALTNAAKHAEAASVSVEATIAPTRVRLVVRDDGKGGATAGGDAGLRGLVERVEVLGGTFELWSPPGCGTRLSVELPVIGS